MSLPIVNATMKEAIYYTLVGISGVLSDEQTMSLVDSKRRIPEVLDSLRPSRAISGPALKVLVARQALEEDDR